MTAIQRRSIFFVSDGTGITAETIGHSLLTQFEGIEFKQYRVPFVDSEHRAMEVRNQIEKAAGADHLRPIVINTFVDQRLSAIIHESPGLVLDIFDTFLGYLEKEFRIRRSPRVGQAHGLVDYHTYEKRMAATNFALKHDDGADVNYEDAEVILVGVSRSGKTPTCLYLALHYGVHAGNYPLTEEDLGHNALPRRLRPFKKKLYGLTIDPERLHQIREARRPGSRYALLKQCQREVEEAESLFRMHRIACVNTTHTSIEEIASKVLLAFKLERNLY